MPEQRKKIMFLIVGIFIGLALLLAVLAVYWQLAPMFRNTVAIVEQDAQDLAEIEKVQEQEKPDLTILEEMQEVTTALADFDLKGISTQSTSAIPTAIFAQEKIDEKVDNILLVLDSKFYLVSYSDTQPIKHFCHPSCPVSASAGLWLDKFA